MSSIIEMERNWKYDWIRRTIERMEEQEKEGNTDIHMHVRELLSLLSQLLGAQQRCDRLEDVLCSYAKYAFPAMQRIDAPAMFGGTVGQHETKSKE